MSDFKCCFTRVKDVQVHPDPATTSLDIITVYGFQIVARKGQYQIGDFVFFIPVDAILNQDLETLILGPDPKIKFDRHRVKQVKIRKFPSQGLLVDPAIINKYCELKKIKLVHKLEEDVSSLLDLHKYEPPAPKFQQNATTGEKKRKKNNNNPLLHSYNGLSNLKWYPDLFKEDEEVVIQEKLHGTNCRAGILPTAKPKLKHLVLALRYLDFGNAFQEAKNLILNAFGKLPKYEFCYGSNNVELTNRAVDQNFYGENVYAKALSEAVVNSPYSKKPLPASMVMEPMEVIYGEIIGAGLQKGYDYGHKDEKVFVLFDVKIMSEDGTFKWLNPEEVERYAKERGFRFVPVLYRGPYNAAAAKELTKGDSVYCPSQKVREGVVIKSRFGYNDSACASQKRALKLISEKYLEGDNDDFH